MNSVMLSIQPKWVEKIVNGEKTIEVRKTRPKIETPFKCDIYMSQGDLKDLGSHSEWIYKNRKKVIGEFICDKVYSIKNQGSSFVVVNEEQGVTNEIARQSCLDYDDMVGYLGNKDGYGLHITALKIYDNPKELSEFNRPCVSPTHDCEDCIQGKTPYTWDFDEDKGTIFCTRKIKIPPQSWQYVEEL